MKKYAALLLPKPAISIALLVIPFAATVFFIFTQYSNKFIAEQNVEYFDIQNDIARKILFDNSLAVGFNRFSDFLFWGILAAIIIVLSWFFGVMKTTASNHTAVEAFNNFQIDNASWHRSFAIKIVIKILLVIIGLYVFLRLLSQLIPTISTAVGNQLRENNSDNIKNIVLANLAVYFALLLITTVFKMYRHISVE